MRCIGKGSVKSWKESRILRLKDTPCGMGQLKNALKRSYVTSLTAVKLEATVSVFSSYWFPIQPGDHNRYLGNGL